MLNVLFPMVAGLFITLQGIFNSKIAEKVGLWESNVLIHTMGLSLTLVLLFLFGKGNFSNITQVNPLYILGGFFGAIIVFTVTQSFLCLSPTFAVLLLLITQLVVASIIDYFGLFGTTPVKFDVTKFLGLAIMIVGIIVYKMES